MEWTMECLGAAAVDLLHQLRDGVSLSGEHFGEGDGGVAGVFVFFSHAGVVLQKNLYELHARRLGHLSS